MSRTKKQRLAKRPDGRYACRYQGKWFYGTSSDEALAAREAYKLGLTSACSNITVGDYAFKWLKIHRASVKPNTIKSYQTYIQRFVDEFGTVSMRDITSSDIKQAYNKYLAASESTIKKVRMLLTSMWDCAVDDGLVKSNPCRTKGAKPHKGTEGSHRALTEAEDKLIFEMDERLRLAVLVMRYAGLRRGEVMAFDVDEDVDFDNDIIHVKEAVRFEGNKSKIVKPKTDAGTRDVPLFSILKEELKGVHGKLVKPVKAESITTSSWRSLWSHYKQSAEYYMNGCYHYWYGRTKAHKELLAAEKPLPKWIPFTVRPHDLRHSYCTMLRDSGVDLKLAIRWMGHADEKMVLRIYDHITDKRISSAIASVEANFSRT